jgi:hypothetical protein
VVEGKLRRTVAAAMKMALKVSGETHVEAPTAADVDMIAVASLCCGPGFCEVPRPQIVRVHENLLMVRDCPPVPLSLEDVCGLIYPTFLYNSPPLTRHHGACKTLTCWLFHN